MLQLATLAGTGSGGILVLGEVKSKGCLVLRGESTKLGVPVLSLRPVDESYLYVCTYNLCTPFPSYRWFWLCILLYF